MATEQLQRLTRLNKLIGQCLSLCRTASRRSARAGAYAKEAMSKLNEARVALHKGEIAWANLLMLSASWSLQAIA